MGLFKKKLSDEELIKKNIEAQQAELEEKEAAKNKKEDDLGDSKLGIEITKVKAQVEGLNEQRQAVNERFSRISEEIGEIRGMVMDTNKAVGNIEASATKAIDLVESVKPDQLMLEVRKQDSKIESLKANIESNESLMKDLMSEIKAIRKRMDFYKGVEQVAKMNEEIKGELIDIKKIESSIERHSNKVESIFLEVEKKFAEFDKYGVTAKDLQRSFQKLQGDVDKLRVKAEDKADKKEVTKIISKFNEFEKHTTKIINLLDERSKDASNDFRKQLDNLISEAKKKVDSALKQIGVKKTSKKSWKLFGKKREEPPKEEAKPEEQKEEKKEEAQKEESKPEPQPKEEKQEEPKEAPKEEKPEPAKKEEPKEEKKQEQPAKQEEQQISLEPTKPLSDSKQAFLDAKPTTQELEQKLEKAIQKEDLNTAITFYNVLKDEYLPSQELSFEERKAIYKYLLKVYKELVALANKLNKAKG